jgi:D-alanyl-D-alanine carboxypeptidase
MGDVFNKSTAADIGRLAYCFLKEDDLRKIVSTKEYKCVITNAYDTRKITYRNTNKMLDFGFEGVKTGITNNAGPCLCSTIRRRNVGFVITLINSNSMEHRWHETAKLAEWAYAQLTEYK